MVVVARYTISSNWVYSLVSTSPHHDRPDCRSPCYHPRTCRCQLRRQSISAERCNKGECSREIRWQVIFFNLQKEVFLPCLPPVSHGMNRLVLFRLLETLSPQGLAWWLSKEELPGETISMFLLCVLHFREDYEYSYVNDSIGSHLEPSFWICWCCLGQHYRIRIKKNRKNHLSFRQYSGSHQGNCWFFARSRGCSRTCCASSMWSICCDGQQI